MIKNLQRYLVKLICEAYKDCHSQMKKIKSPISISLISHAKAHIADCKGWYHEAKCVRICLNEVMLTHCSGVDMMFTKWSDQTKKTSYFYILKKPLRWPYNRRIDAKVGICSPMNETRKEISNQNTSENCKESFDRENSIP